MHERVALFILPLVFAISLGLTLGLTFLPCYSSLCSEEFYPFGTRIHIASFYVIVAAIALVLALRGATEVARSVSEFYILRKPAPILDKRISLGGTLLAVWILGMVLATTAFWWPLQHDFYQVRGEAVDWTVGTVQLAVTGLIGHHADLCLGLLLLPVARVSLLGQTFELGQSTLLFAHKLLGYLTFVAVVAHGVTYFSWIPKFAKADGAKKNAFGVDNPTLSLDEGEHRGLYSFLVLPTGAISLVLFIILVITSLPSQRRARYNLFYYTHIVAGSLIFVLASIHASTDFYFLLPGLVLWLGDWAARLRWLRKSKTEAVLEDAGQGWYRIRLRHCLRRSQSQEVAQEQPLQSYYLNFPTISKLQCHAFTAASVGSTTEGPSFLFRRAEGKKQPKLDKEWTWKLGQLVESQRTNGTDKHASTTLALRLEGPYVTPAAPFLLATHVLCLVGGTGITGALSLAQVWRQQRASERNARFRIVWTIRTVEAAQIDELEDLRRLVDTGCTNIDVVTHVSSQAGRINPMGCLQSFFGSAASDKGATQHIGESKASDAHRHDMREDAVGWVYCSGPGGLLEAADAACLDLRREIRSANSVKQPDTSSSLAIKDFNWYCAKWEV